MIHVEFRPRFADGRLSSMIELLDSLRGPLRDRGIDWGSGSRAADLIWANQHQVCRRSDRPLIMHEVHDSAAVNWSARRWLAESHVRLAVKGTAYRPRRLVNAPHYEHSYHGAILYDSAPERERPADDRPEPLEPAIPEAALARIRLGYNWLFHPHLDALASASEEGGSAPRDIDVFFAGTMAYARWHIGWHRGRAARVLERMPGRVIVGRGRPFPQPEYRRLLWRSRIVVSPWGFGETCIRDVEALLAGCILVKPATRFCETWPDYHRAANCLWCRPDFADAPAVVGRALDAWKRLETARRETAVWLRRQRRPELLANRIASLVREALSQP